MGKRGFAGLLTGLLVLSWAALGLAADVIKIGFNIELTGDIPKVGEASKYAGEMLKERINKAGRVEGRQQDVHARVRLSGQ